MATPSWFPLAAALLTAFLAAGSGRAQENIDFGPAARDLIGEVKGRPRAAGRIGSWGSAETAEWIDAGTFRGPFGMKVYRSCLGLEGKA